MSRFPKSGSFWFTVLAITLLGVSGGLTIGKWDWLHSSTPETAPSTTLRNVGFLIAGVLAFVFAVWRGWVAERQANAAQLQAETALRQAETAQQSLLNERYQRGAEMLGSAVPSVRLGGIYSLRRLAEGHPEQYHIQTMELFCAFVRNPTVSESDPPKLEMIDEPRSRPILREDLQVILTALGSRREASIDLEKATKEFRLELHHADLGGAQLPSANFASANLGGANMRGVYLCDADLSVAYLQGADLRRVNLIHANLSGARLSANLAGAIAQGADFSRADLGGANLSHADLRWANMSGVNFGTANLSEAVLEGVNLSGAVFGKGTRTTLSDSRVSEDVFARLSQRQLDQAKADSNNPPKIAEGTVDSETGKQLVWRGKTLVDHG